MKNKEKEEAIRLRQNEKLSLSEIGKRISVSKSSLSLWLRNYPLDVDVRKAKQSHAAHKRNEKARYNSPIKIKPISFDNWSTDDKGQLAMLKVEIRALDKKVIISKPSIEGCRYDCVVDDNGHLSRVQVKMANGCTRSTNTVSVSLSQTSRSGKQTPCYTSNEIDAILVYIPSTEEICWLPPEVWENKTRLNIRLAPTQNGQRKKCLFAQEFTW